MTQTRGSCHDSHGSRLAITRAPTARDTPDARSAAGLHGLARLASRISCLLVACGSLGCSTSDFQCNRWRRFDVDAEISGDDALRACLTFGKPLYDEYDLAEIDRSHRLCPGEPIPDDVPPDDVVFVEYAPTCQALCWIRQQRFVEATGTGTLGLSPSAFFEGVPAEWASGDALIREVAECESNVDLSTATGAQGVLGEIRCSGTEYFYCEPFGGF